MTTKKTAPEGLESEKQPSPSKKPVKAPLKKAAIKPVVPSSK
jgi:hypothetical protein